LHNFALENVDREDVCDVTLDIPIASEFEMAVDEQVKSDILIFSSNAYIIHF
jgi:hypothetical protein